MLQLLAVLQRTQGMDKSFSTFGNTEPTLTLCASMFRNGSSPLHLAVGKGNKEITKLLLSKGADVNARGNDDVTSLHIATRGGYLKIVKQLLKYGADLHSTSPNVQTPLYFAVENEHEKVVKLLLEHGANIHAEDKNNKTILYSAVEQGSPIIVERILKHCPDLNNKSNSGVLNAAVQGHGFEYNNIVKHLLEYGFTVKPEDASNFMHAAVQNGHLELVEELLKHGADVNMLSDSALGKASIPLHVATNNGHEEVAKLLISHGADVNALDESGKTPIFYATKNASLKMTKLLLNNKANIKDNPELLNIAVKEDRREIVEVLLQHGADVNATDEYGRMPLHFVVSDEAERGFECCSLKDPDVDVKGEVAKLLLSWGANANTRVRNRMTMLLAATDKGYVQVVKALLKYKADVNSTYGSGLTPLHLSVIQGDKVITKMLLKRGANVRAKCTMGQTALYFAIKGAFEIEADFVKIIRLLLKHGAQVNATVSYGFIKPLHLAARYGNPKIVKLLLKFGAEIDSISNDRATPLHVAATYGCVKIVEILLKFGASVDFADIYGTTALHNATKSCHENIVIALLEHGCDITLETKDGESNYTALDLALDCIRSIRNDYRYNYNPAIGSDEYNYGYYKTCTYIHIADTLKREMVKMRIANLYAGNDDILSIPSYTISSFYAELGDFDDGYEGETESWYNKRVRKERRMPISDFKNECEKEIAVMKSEKVLNANITFYDILTKDVGRLAMYARNESIVEAFGSGDYRDKFPTYACMINNNFRQGERRKEFLEQGNKILDLLFNDFPELPRGCTERIFSYLNNDDLRALRGYAYLQGLKAQVYSGFFYQKN